MPIVAIRIFATTAFAAIAIATVALGAHVTAADNSVSPALKPPVIGPSGPIVQLSGLDAGELNWSKFTVRNDNDIPAALWISGRLTGGSAPLYDLLFTEVRSTTTSGDSWSGSLRSFDQMRQTANIPANGSREFEVNVMLPGWAGNSYQDKLSQFDFNFTFDTPSSGFDLLPPRSTIRSGKPKRPRRGKRKKNILFYGKAQDAETAIARVELSLVRAERKRGKKLRCSHWVPARKKFMRKPKYNCAQIWFTASGRENWLYNMPIKKLRKGKYVLMSRAVDAAGNAEPWSSKRLGNKLSFTWRR